jgi:hypothetical protein
MLIARHTLQNKVGKSFTENIVAITIHHFPHLVISDFRVVTASTSLTLNQLLQIDPP